MKNLTLLTALSLIMASCSTTQTNRIPAQNYTSPGFSPEQTTECRGTNGKMYEFVIESEKPWNTAAQRTAVVDSMFTVYGADLGYQGNGNGGSTGYVRFTKTPNSKEIVTLECFDQYTN